MNRFLALAVVVTATCDVFAADTSTDSRVDRPNILYFYVDDMGWGSIGPNGQADRRAQGLPVVRTPNLDQLARQGVNFTRGYGCHVCSPARSSQQTGFHQGHTFADRNDPNNAKKAIRADDVCIGDALSDAGYTTGYWGKWGYGGSKDRVTPTIDNVQTLPTSHGYQHVLAELHHVRAHTFFQPTLWKAPAANSAIGGVALAPNSMAKYRNENYPATPALQNHSAYPEVAYCDDSYAMAALDFVREQGTEFNKTGTPFLGILAVQIPHAPFGEISTLPDWNAEYADDPAFLKLSDQTKQWAAMVTRIDAHFGNILRALDDPNNDGDKSDSIANNTLVVFQSDNGGPAGKNNVELDANGGLRKNKGSIHEGGIRVPLVMRWPARINAHSKLKAGTNCDKVVDVTDLLPTFCELAGFETPLGIDGVSIAPTLTGRGHQRERAFIIHEAGDGQSIIQGSHKLIRKGKPRGNKFQYELYDLETDPSESNDIASKHPKRVKQMKELLLGERVAEPRGFANTYHQWTAQSEVAQGEADVLDANNWSDYVYANAGVTYMTDDGPPQTSWVARINNNASKPAISRLTSGSDDSPRTLDLLALELSGKSAEQTFIVDQTATLSGRNEIRINDNGKLNLQGGTVSTLRWIDVRPGGSLIGHGTVQGDLYNDGAVGAQRPLELHGDFRQSDTGSLTITISDGQPSTISCTENAFIAWATRNQNSGSRTGARQGLSDCECSQSCWQIRQ